MINWQIFPKSLEPTNVFKAVISCFEKAELSISSEKHHWSSDIVLKILRPHLEGIGFRVESGKKKVQRIRVPVLFGRQGVCEKSFEVDAHHKEERAVLEVEAGRGVLNYQFLKDLFEACTMQNVDYLILAVRNIYGKWKKQKDFETVLNFFETLYASGRMQLPLKGILVLGY